MKKELHDVAEHIKNLGLAMLSHSLRHSLQEYFVQSDSTSYMDSLGVIQAAHACEILIKARIAEEHPLLIFSKLPESNKGKPINLETLAALGKTFQYNELPDRLWATTGCKIEERKLFDNFGYLRNSIQHFATPRYRNLTVETIEFIFKVIEPLIHQFWGLYATRSYVENPLDPLGIFPTNHEDYEPPHNDIFNVLLKLNIDFLIADKDKEQVEKDRKKLESIVQAADFIQEFSENSMTECEMISKIKSQFDLSELVALRLHAEASDMLRRKIKYQNWRIAPF